MSGPQTANDEAFRLDGVELVRGKRAETRLRTVELADGSWVELPVILLRGVQPGPVFYLGAAFHGDEVNGVEIATRFAGTIELAELRGTVVVVPVQNPLALQAQHRYFVGHFLKSPLDQSPADPWISFPGDGDGNLAAQIAARLFTALIRHSQYLIDIHTPTTGGRYAPFAFLPPPGVGAPAEAAEAMAKVFGADYILSTHEGLYVSEQSPHVVMARRGATAMGVELGEGGRLESEITEQGLRGLRNVFRHIGMLPGEVERFGRNHVIRSMHVVRAKRGGLVHRRVELNDEVQKGQVVATITNVFGERTEEIRAPISGPVVRIATFPIVSAGERVIQLGVPL
ncbi:MAG TPA: succinylglutamate desuccinylase/aspartoacylase family protein [Alphaproteobacteria bacterium]|nr:succinylglutamate desuccinylase/aspartoacylase family protein [Alphaproteobacteria bacterium]